MSEHTDKINIELGTLAKMLAKTNAEDVHKLRSIVLCLIDFLPSEDKETAMDEGREELHAKINQLIDESGEDAEPRLSTESLGRLVREVWIEWAKAQPDPKPSWLVPWAELDERDKDADRQIAGAIRDAVLKSLAYESDKTQLSDIPREEAGRLLKSADIFKKNASYQEPEWPFPECRFGSSVACQWKHIAKFPPAGAPQTTCRRPPVRCPYGE